MGARISHMNIYAMSTIIQCNKMQYENIIRSVEGRKILEPVLPILVRKIKNDNDNDNDNIEMEEETLELLNLAKNDSTNGTTMMINNTQIMNNSNIDEIDDDIIQNDNYMVSSSMLIEILQSLNIDNADIYTNYYYPLSGFIRNIRLLLSLMNAEL